MECESKDQERVNLPNAQLGNKAVTTTLASATQSTTEVGKGTSFEHDRIARRHDDRGNPVPYGITYIPPISGSQDLEHTELRHLLAQIADVDPVKAAYLGHLFQDRLRKAFQRLQDVRREVEEELKQGREQSISLSKEIAPIVEQLEQQQEAALAEPQANMSENLNLIDNAHAVASDRVAAAGGSYEPGTPSDDCVLRVSRKSSGVTADRLQLPWGLTARAFKLPSWLVWVMTFLCGSVIGVSLSILAGFIEELFADLPVLITWVVLGQGFAIAMRKAINWAFFCFAESFYLRQPRRKQVSWFSVAVIVFFSLLLAAMTVDSHGILKLAQFQALLSGTDQQPISNFAMQCMAAVVTLGYLIYSGYDGIVCGRNDAIENAIAAEIERDFEERSENRRSLPVVQEALRALNHVRRMMASIAMIRANISAISAEFAQRIAKAEEGGTVFPDELSADQKFRVQDALQNLIGCQLELDAVLASVLGVAQTNGQTRSRPSRSTSESAKPLGFWDRIRKVVRAR